ncbi:MAG: hypothetical protein QNJ34_03485 [Xenococcaceae cyanobacterium MO_188.B29]|nr:hypothetical protein [Xenococcaceae cyanobacterium MO_188.B29]
MANKDFFLSPDDAQTLGDINYMRKSVRVRHTFPKNLKNPNGFEIVKDVSSSEDRAVNKLNNNRSQNSFSQPAINTQNTFSPQPAKSASKSSTQSTNMDMFRNMARSIGKK